MAEFIEALLYHEFKKKTKKRSSRYLGEFLKANEHPRDELMETHIEEIIDMPKCSEQPDNRDIKLELITMLKHFLDRKLISQHIEKIILVSCSISAHWCSDDTQGSVIRAFFLKLFFAKIERPIPVSL